MHIILPSRSRMYWLVLGGLLLLTAFVLAVWLAITPPGVMSKLDAIGYAVCHRIADRSFDLGGRASPLCARCSGTFLGALLACLFQLPRGRRGGTPKLAMLIAFSLFFIPFGLDGLNSYLHFFPGAPQVYTPHNWLRLATGTGLGLWMGVILYPIIQQTWWETYIDEPSLATWKQAGLLILLAIGLDLVILSGVPLFLYPLTAASSLMVVGLLSFCFALAWTLAFHREGKMKDGWDILPFLFAGFLNAMLMVLLINAARFAFTGTWGAFPWLSGF